MRRGAMLLALVWATGCGEIELPDGGPDADAGFVDSGIPDSGETDANTPDTGAVDTGVSDPGDAQADAGFPDSGVPEDAGFEDTGVHPDVGPGTYTLTVTFTGDGAGQVSSSPDLGTCNASCTRFVSAGTTVDLTAVAGARAVFGAFVAPACGANASCAVSMDQDRTVEVRFDALHTVTVVTTGDGLGRVDGLGPVCAPGCVADHPTGTALALTAVPAAGVRFAGWGGACTGNGDCNLTVTGAHSVEPRWEVITPQLGQAPGGHMCALGGPRSVRCWGNGSFGQLGRQSNDNIGDDEIVAALGDLPLGLDVIQVETGGTFTCVLQKSGGVRCWGWNNFGQLGRGDTTPVGGAGYPAPANISDIDLGGPALQIALGGWHACALMATGAVRCWGRGVDGALGYGDTNNVADGSTGISSPALAGDVDLGPGLTARAVATGAYHSCAILTSNEVKCWGSNEAGQLGYPFSGHVGDGNALRPLPRDVSTLGLGSAVEELALGTEMSCARLATGTIKCWGRNVEGQLGTGSFQAVGGAQGIPLSQGVAVDLGAQTALQIRAGADHVCAITSGGEVRCWGGGGFGRLGYLASDNLNTPPGPVNLGTASPAVVLGMSGLNTCAIVRATASPFTETVYCWGRGDQGVLGTGTTTHVGNLPGTMPPAPTPLF